MLIRVLLLIEPAALRRRLTRQIADPHTLVIPARAGSDCWSEISRHACDLVIVEHSAVRDALADFIGTVRALPDEPEVVILCRREDPEERAALLAAGSYAVIYEGLDDPALAGALGTLISRRRDQALRLFQSTRHGQQPSLRDFVSASPAMQAFLSAAYRVLPSDSSLLILGETGTGKEHLAQALHNEGPRSAGPFIPVNCASPPEALLESELFGHKKGAFAGEIRPRRGSFEMAHRGTIFLDEICGLPAGLQTRLLQSLQDRQIRPLGGRRSVPVDVRVIAATNRDLEAEVRAGRFREDLFFRLSVVSLWIPPLRERLEDIPLLLEACRQRWSARLGRACRGIRQDAVDALVRYPWPGNVREIENVMERAVLLCAGEEITLAHLPEGFGLAGASAASAPGRDAAPPGLRHLLNDRMLDMPWKRVRKELLEALEREYLAGHLERSRGRIGETARRAGMEPRSLHEKMKRLGLRKEDFRSQEAERAR